ncbi:MAG TPA: HAMP domain-containing sensor histidine kinase [Planctomycetota bacterium]|nr:HAMP domain-containing sensor histidine kinase [Planctomycetota bacterium]
MSLTTRITLLVVGLLAVGGAGSGAAIYFSEYRELRDNVEGRLDARLLWLQTSLEVEDGRLQLGPVPEAEGAAPNWEISRHGGQVLWSSMSRRLHRPVVVKSISRTMGDPTWPTLAASRLEETTPPAAHASERDRDTKLLYFTYFALPDETRRVDLILTAWDSAADMETARRRLRAILWSVGPAALAGVALLFALVIRWQLKPLGVMAEQAARIGPDTLSCRISPAGTSTECVRLRETINAMLGRLAEGLERERRFASMAAHELRTPLAQLRTHLEVSLRRERTSDEYRENLRYAMADVDRLQSLIHGLLQLARAADGPKVPGHPVRLGGLLRKAERGASPAALRLPAELENVQINGEEELLASAISNVLENAAIYAPGAPPELNAAIDDGRVVLTVADHGPGVPEADRERIFAPLVRLDPARTIGDKPGGFGLGLSIARASVRSFGGDLACRQRSDGAPGTEFVFTFPVAARD